MDSASLDQPEKDTYPSLHKHIKENVAEKEQPMNEDVSQEAKATNSRNVVLIERLEEVTFH